MCRKQVATQQSYTMLKYHITQLLLGNNHDTEHIRITQNKSPARNKDYEKVQTPWVKRSQIDKEILN